MLKIPKGYAPKHFNKNHACGSLYEHSETKGIYLNYKLLKDEYLVRAFGEG